MPAGPIVRLGFNANLPVPPPMQRYPRLRDATLLGWVLFVVIAIYASFGDSSSVHGFAAIVIVTFSLAPAYLWAEGRIQGLPIVPIHCLTLIWTYAFPLISGHPEILSYDNDAIGFATLSVVLYAIAATLPWIIFGNRLLVRNSYFRLLPIDRAYSILITAIISGAAFTILAVTHSINMDPGLYGILRSTVMALAAIATFLLSLRLGGGHLNPTQRAMFLTVLTTFAAVQVVGLFLVGSIVTLASALIGYTVGKNRVPWIAVALIVVVFGFLHAGKAEMRDKYWSDGDTAIGIGDMPRLFGEWFSASSDALRGPRADSGRQSIVQRVSLMHLLLLVQRDAPGRMPYLDGATYTIIPRLLVPRFIDPDKPDSHQGTTMLNIQFGLQSVDDAEHTTIGWGLLNEGYANFGLWGIVAVALFLGSLFTVASRLTIGAPMMSLQFMVGVTICAIAFQAEYTMAVFATVLFQSLVVLAVLLPFLEWRRADQEM